MAAAMSFDQKKKRPNARDAPPATPARIMRIAFGFAPAHALASALDLRLFTHIADGQGSCELLQRVTGASRRGLWLLLEAMEGLGLLTRRGMGAKACYALTAEAAAYLVEGRPGYHGDLVCLHLRRQAEHWTDLTERIRFGTPVLAELAELLRAHQLLEAAMAHASPREPGQEGVGDHALRVHPTTGPTTPRR
jgi:hypothetical protein